MQKLDALIEKLLEIIIVFCLSITVIITFLQVLLRYVFDISFGWSQEVLMISFIFSVFFGAALAVKNNEHLQVDILDNAPKKVKNVLKVLEMIVVGVMIVVFIIYGWRLVQNNFNAGTIIGVLPIKVAFVNMILPISGIFMLYFYLKQVIKWRR
ncbi:TRAP transporter small permease [Virgibacillus ihumii]|uniref:TRAP transporter small permease n=1 Tax=Virgibacillus ihumii TaxID=2686091 RepID=UPI00157C85EA|nr:TRAP transporter small permease [Virgibacillus ihumii]